MDKQRCSHFQKDWNHCSAPSATARWNQHATQRLAIIDAQFRIAKLFIDLEPPSSERPELYASHPKNRLYDSRCKFPMLSPSADPVRRLLVVDDDNEMRLLIARKLVSAGFEVQTAVSGRHALDIIERNGLPHLAIVDINMPGMNGLEFCETIQQSVDLPVIMVTAVSESATTIKAIELYAEDYIIKPFNLDELVVRVQRVLRRLTTSGHTDGPNVIISPHLAVNFLSKTALVGGVAVTLTPTESKLLYLFWRNAGRLLTNDFLLSRLWPGEEIYEETLRVHVHRLRQKIERPDSAEKHILTERGQGYRFIVDQSKIGK